MKRLIIISLILTFSAFLTANAAVVINELYYDHPSDDTGHEFLELYNNGAEDVDLTGWQVQWAGTDFTYGIWDLPAGAIIAAGDYLLLGGDETEADFGVVPDHIYNFGFQNGGTATDGVRITDEVINPTDPYYDTNLYGEPNTNGLRGDDADPGLELCPDVDAGHSLERVAVGVDNNLAADWFDNDAPTPTRSATAVPPVIHWTMNYPEIIASFEEVAVMDSVTDDGTIVSGTVYYSVNGVDWITDDMEYDADLGWWVGWAPAQSAGTEVWYYVSATDNDGLTTLDPPDAPASYYTYTVDDLVLSPTIAEIRVNDPDLMPLYMDSLFIIEGIVTCTNEYGIAGPAYIQDATAGLAVYNANWFESLHIEIGDCVRVYGWMGFYNGLTELVSEPGTGDPAPSVVFLGDGVPVEAEVIVPTQMGEDYEGELIMFQDAVILGSGNFPLTSNGTYDVVVGSDTATMFIDKDTDIAGMPIPTGTVNITGVHGQFDDYTAPYDGGYQIIPRMYSDFEITGDPPPFIGDITQEPQIVTPEDEVNITALIYDNSGLLATQLWYQITVDEWVMTELFDDGLHGDGAAGDSVFGAYIPAQVEGATVEYYLYAEDDANQVTLNPVEGAANPYSYNVTSPGVITPIIDVREIDENFYPVNFGLLYTVKGIITSGIELGASGPAYLQDETAGIAFYDYLVTTSGMAIGDSVELTGYVDFYNGLIQLADEPFPGSGEPSVTILSSGNDVTYTTVAGSDLGETYEGQLVKINDVQFLDIGTFTGSTSYTVVADGDTFTIYIDSSTDIPGNAIPTDPVDVVGCVGQYDTSSPYDEYYQLLPRYMVDISTAAVVTPILTVRENDPDGFPVNIDSMFTIEGLMTVSDQMGTGGPAFIQDETAGIALYDYPVTMFGEIGDMVRITGWVGFYNGLTQMVDEPGTGTAPTVEILSSGNPVEAAAITPGDIDEGTEAELVEIEGCLFIDTGTFSGDTNYDVVCGADTFTVRIDTDTDIPGNPIPTVPVDITGVISQYDYSSPYFEGYQLLPRFITDITESIIATPIATVRENDPDGYPVNIDSMFTIEGLITVSQQFSSPTYSGPAYMQDATGGIALYDSPVTMFGEIGDMVRITGWVGFYSGLTQMVDEPGTGTAPTVEILSSGNPVTALVITPTEIGEEAEAELVIIGNCAFIDTGNFSGNTNYDVVCGADTFTVRIDNDTDIPDNPIPIVPVDITGVISQYDYSSPYFEGYQLLPRFITDIIESAAPGIVDVVITIIDDDVRLDWSVVPGATLYHIYASDFPYSGFIEMGSTTDNWYLVEDVIVGETARHFYVTYEN